MVTDKKGCKKVAPKAESLEYADRVKLPLDREYYISNMINPLEKILQYTWIDAEALCKTAIGLSKSISAKTGKVRSLFAKTVGAKDRLRAMEKTMKRNHARKKEQASGKKRFRRQVSLRETLGLEASSEKLKPKPKKKRQEKKRRAGRSLFDFA